MEPHHGQNGSGATESWATRLERKEVRPAWPFNLTPRSYPLVRSANGRKNALSSAARIGAQLMPSRPYKDLIIYGCFVLNRLVAEIGNDLYQGGLDAKLAPITPNQHAVLQEERKRENKSNHFTTAPGL